MEHALHCICLPHRFQCCSTHHNKHTACCPACLPAGHHHHHHHRDTTELQLISTTGDSPGQVKQRIASHPLVDIGEVVFEVADRQPSALALAYHKPVWSFAQQDDQQEWQRLEAWRPGEVAQPVSRSQDKKASA